MLIKIVLCILQRTGSVELIDNDLLLEDLLAQSRALKKEEANKKNDAKDDATWHSRSLIFMWDW